MHPHLPRLAPAALLLSLVYAAAIAVALTAPGADALAGAVVAAGLVTRWALRHRSRATTALPRDPAVAPAPASPA